jgi:BioD-like phosphotransacetylase family protein
VLKSLYIASTQGSGGKTTIAVGLCVALRRRGLQAGYFKPVGTLASE